MKAFECSGLKRIAVHVRTIKPADSVWSGRMLVRMGWARGVQDTKHAAQLLLTRKVLQVMARAGWLKDPWNKVYRCR